MTVEKLKEFNTTYNKKTKHRKKCRECGKLIKDGSEVVMQQYKTEKYYPVKGLMWFTNWFFFHKECFKSEGETNEA